MPSTEPQKNSEPSPSEKTKSSKPLSKRPDPFFPKLSDKDFKRIAAGVKAIQDHDRAAGSRFVERMLSVVATCRQQNRNVLDFLTACCGAPREGSTPPSLLPQRALAVRAA